MSHPTVPLPGAGVLGWLVEGGHKARTHSVKVTAQVMNRFLISRQGLPDVTLRDLDEYKGGRSPRNLREVGIS